MLQEELAKLAGRLARGQPAQAAYDYDPENGITPNGPPYPSGAASGVAVGQPAGSYSRLERATFSWRGGVRGLDRPVGRGFVVIQRRKRGRWRRVTSDLGLEILWSVDDQGRYQARWEIPLQALQRWGGTGS